ncbi:MAG: hypothetical protein ACKOOA_07645, partial [Sediminibacterium sp.]
MNLRNPLKSPFPWLALALLVVSLPACLKKLTVKNIIYENSFADGELSGLKVSGWNNGSFGTLSDPRISYYNGQYVLGKLNNNIVRLQLNSLPQHDILLVELELNHHNNWKNELLKMEFDGETRLLNGFSK